MALSVLGSTWTAQKSRGQPAGALAGTGAGRWCQTVPVRSSVHGCAFAVENPTRLENAPGDAVKHIGLTRSWLSSAAFPRRVQAARVLPQGRAGEPSCPWLANQQLWALRLGSLAEACLENGQNELSLQGERPTGFVARDEI